MGFVWHTDYGQWNADELKNLWSANGTKSKYDPCPAGYSVAPMEALDAVKTQLGTAKLLKDDSYVVDPSTAFRYSPLVQSPGAPPLTIS